MRFSRVLVVAVFIGGCDSTASITNLSIRNADFEIVKDLVLDDLPEFRRQGKVKQEVDVELANDGGQLFKLDFTSRGSGERWPYYTTGYIWQLSHQ